MGLRCRNPTSARSPLLSPIGPYSDFYQSMEWRAPVTEGVWEMAFVVMADFFLIFMGPSKEEGERELQIRGCWEGKGWMI